MIEWKYDKWESYKFISVSEYMGHKDKAVIEALRMIAEKLDEISEHLQELKNDHT